MDADFQANLLRRISGNSQLSEAERHLLKTSQAKYVRPSFLYACGALLDAPRDVMFDYACAVELIHTGTLLHDDIIDKALTRRSIASVNAQYGDKLAILAGDSLLARALHVLSESPQQARTIRRTTKTIMAMTEGVSLELELQTSKQQKADILLVIDGKTGALFSLCGYLAGIAANDESAAEKFAHIGMELGRVFQINDDLDDIDEDTDNNILTLPVYAGEQEARDTLKRSSDAIAVALRDFAGNPALPNLQQHIKMISRIR